MQNKVDVGMALNGLKQRAHDDAGAGIATHGIYGDGQGAGHGHLSGVRPLALGLHDFAVGIMAAGTADMMRALGLAAIGAVAMGGSRQGMVRAAHVAARRRGFSFRDRHGGKTPKSPRKAAGA